MEILLRVKRAKDGTIKETEKETANVEQYAKGVSIGLRNHLILGFSVIDKASGKILVSKGDI